MTPDQIAELQNLTVDEIAERAPSLDAADLVALRRLETEDGQKAGRKGVIAAIDAAEAASNTPAPPAAADTTTDPAPTPAQAPRQAVASPAAAATPTTPAWHARDYNGPLTIDQASWRRANLKPVRGAHTK